MKSSGVSLKPTSTLCLRASKQSPQHPCLASQIKEGVSAFEDVQDRSLVISLDPIEEEGLNLNISRYVQPLIGTDSQPFSKTMAFVNNMSSDWRETKNNLRQTMIDGVRI